MNPREQERERLDLEMEADDDRLRWARFAPLGDGLVVWRDWTVGRASQEVRRDN